jgi:hypothetical protein
VEIREPQNLTDSGNRVTKNVFGFIRSGTFTVLTFDDRSGEKNR